MMEQEFLNSPGLGLFRTLSDEQPRRRTQRLDDSSDIEIPIEVEAASDDGYLQSARSSDISGTSGPYEHPAWNLSYASEKASMDNELHNWKLSDLLGVPPSMENKVPDFTDYRQKYRPDEHFQEASDNARVWRTYLDESEIFDKEMIKRWTDTISMLLVFAALFSAILSTFIVETMGDLQPDYAQISATLLVRLVNAVESGALSSAQGALIETLPPDPAHGFKTNPVTVWVNGIWFTSLALSLSTALMAVLVRQWLYSYESNSSGTARERSLIRHYRYLGIRKWQIPLIIGLFPVLLHVALILFLWGLVVFLWSREVRVAAVVTAITGLTLLVYLITHICAIFDPQCPYKTPVVTFLRTIWAYMLTQYRSWNGKRSQVAGAEVPGVTKSSGIELHDVLQVDTSSQLEIDALHWLDTCSFNPTVRPIVFDAISGLPSNSIDAAMKMFEYQPVVQKALGVYGKLTVQSSQREEEFAKFLRTCVFLDLGSIPEQLFRDLGGFPDTGSGQNESISQILSSINPTADTSDMEKILFAEDLRLPAAVWGRIVWNILQGKHRHSPHSQIQRDAPLQTITRLIEDSKITRYLNFLKHHADDQWKRRVRGTGRMPFAGYWMPQEEFMQLISRFIPMLSQFDLLDKAPLSSPWVRLLLAISRLFLISAENLDLAESEIQAKPLFVLQRIAVRCLRDQRIFRNDLKWSIHEKTAIFSEMRRFIESKLFLDMHSYPPLSEICNSAVEVCWIAVSSRTNDDELFPLSSTAWYNQSFLSHLVFRLRNPSGVDPSLLRRDRMLLSRILERAFRLLILPVYEFIETEDVIQLLGDYSRVAREAIPAAAIGAYIVGIRNAFMSGAATQYNHSKSSSRLRQSIHYLHRGDNIYHAFFSLILAFNVEDHRLQALIHVWPHSISFWTECRRRLAALQYSKVEKFENVLRGPLGGCALPCALLQSRSGIEHAASIIHDHAIGGCDSKVTLLRRAQRYGHILHTMITEHEDIDHGWKEGDDSRLAPMSVPEVILRHHNVVQAPTVTQTP